MNVLRIKNFSSLLLIGILLGTWFLYVPTLNFGFIWDDPIWFGHAVGKSWWETLLPNPNFQFYRPLTMLYFWLFKQPDNSFAEYPLHLLQISFHLINILLIFKIGARLNLKSSTALGASLLFALYPFSHQAVAWAAPQQPLAALVQASTLLCYFRARDASIFHSQKRWFLGSLVLFIISLMIQETSVSLAVLPFLYEVFLRREQQFASFRMSLVFIFVGCAYFLIWLNVPRQANVVGLFLDPQNLIYLSQSLSYPLLWRPDGYQVGLESPTLFPVGAAIICLGFIILSGWRQKRFKLIFFLLLWSVCALLPATIGLKYSYVSLAPRLLYASAMGTCLTWAVALQGLNFRKGAFVTVLLTLIIAYQSISFLRSANQLWLSGISHLRHATNRADFPMDEQDAIFLNFPDRYRLKQEPFPAGYWGMTLAPVVVDLSDFGQVWGGLNGNTKSFSMPWLGEADRANSPYLVDMRGVIISGAELVDLAANFDDIYLTNYKENGRFALQPIGGLGYQLTETACPFVTFGDLICLHDATINETNGNLQVNLHWSTQAAIDPNWTIFVHLGNPTQPPLAQDDGFTWKGSLPLTDWPLNQTIEDIRSFKDVDFSGQTIQVGLYNGATGERVAARKGGAQLENNAISLPIED